MARNFKSWQCSPFLMHIRQFQEFYRNINALSRYIRHLPEKILHLLWKIYFLARKNINFVQFSPLSHSALMMWHWQVQSAAGIWTTQSFYQIHHLRKSERTDWKNYIFVKMKISQLQKIWETQRLYCIHRFWNLRGNFFEKLKILQLF